MIVRVKLYSILRDYTGSSELTIEIPDGSRIEDLIRALKGFDGFNKAYSIIGGSILVLSDDGYRLDLSDTIKSKVIHIMPPPSGGSVHIEVGILRSGEDFNISSLEYRLSRVSQGAIAVFVGYVKEYNMGEKVKGLYYEHSDGLVLKIFRRIAEEQASKWGLTGIAIYHYVGWRSVGEKTMIIGVAGGSRKNVIPALAETIDRVKSESPIWKIEYRESGKYYILGDRIIKIEIVEPQTS
ncbi:MAG: molybdenum cofactor biosynthesis protein MoaE [Acidilobaceae archaeon]